MLDTTAPCICCADVWDYIANHIDPDNMLTKDDLPDLPKIHADILPLEADHITVEHLERYIKGEY